MKIKGLYNTAKVFTENVDEATLAQVVELCNQPFVEGEDIRIMPDCHSGAGCVIGTTMTLRNKKIVPNLVGVDIGCGVHVAKINTGINGNNTINLKKFDSIVKAEVPSGFNVRETPHNLSNMISYENLVADVGDLARHKASIGTLGGGNHFIELDKDKEGNIYLVIHSGSRNFGKQIADYWQRKAIETCKADVPKDLAYLEGELYDSYINDMEIAQHFARINRIAIANSILEPLCLEAYSILDTVHNYIDIENGIMRKGAVSADEKRKLIIPMNMRDGSIIAVGKGNADWNYSAPHGAGRILSRAQAKKQVDMADFVSSMDGIYSSTVNENTLDESPMAYKSMEEILKNIGDTVSIVDIIKPIYNFKDAKSRA